MDAKILALYLGCDVQIPLTEFRTGKLTGVYTKAIPAENVNRCQVYHDEQINWFDVEDVKLLLRPLSSMTVLWFRYNFCNLQTLLFPYQ